MSLPCVCLGKGIAPSWCNLSEGIPKGKTAGVPDYENSIRFPLWPSGESGDHTGGPRRLFGYFLAGEKVSCPQCTSFGAKDRFCRRAKSIHRCGGDGRTPSGRPYGVWRGNGIAGGRVPPLRVLIPHSSQKYYNKDMGAGEKKRDTLLLEVCPNG